MSGSPVQMLESLARKKIEEGLQAEKNKDYATAAEKYKRALEALDDIIRNYPDHPLIGLYRRMYNDVKSRLKYVEVKGAQALSLGDDVVKVDIKGEAEQGPDELPEFVLKEKPKVTFNDIAGLEEAKRAIKEAIIYPITKPELFPLGWPRGILLYGPPGTGKTMLAAAVANEVSGEFLYADAASIMSKWLGEGEKNVKRLFEYARSRARSGTPVIIFIDEVDALFGVHSNEVGGEVRVRNQFLKEMDGLQDKNERLHVYVIAATNKPWALDEPFIRRFQKRIYVPLPDLEARRQLLQMLISRLPSGAKVDLDELARRLEGYSGSDIKDLVQDAYMRVVREYFEQKSGLRPVTMEDFEYALSRRKPSVDERMLRAYEEWSEKFKAV
ncbi:MAG: ATP-binding protein [Acidilobus sp.]|nr:ATP-binding protein [Acidilobus sp.]MCG2891657.1 ATP-binding protein [Acidilobus sp.]